MCVLSVCCKCNTESNRVNVFRAVKRNFLLTFRLEVILFTKAREIYKTFSLPYCKASIESKHILQKGHWGKSHLKFHRLQDLKQLIGTGISKAKEKTSIKVYTFNYQQLKAERIFDMVPIQENDLHKADENGLNEI